MLRGYAWENVPTFAINLEAGFKKLIAVFELPLLGRFFARLKECEALCSGVGSSEWL
jgi:hypothetical protein